mmetsp:Transcript_27285/g.49597  ORF Transcript_27285/g.49597 Transcript_27285/m.49597 type:complete len:190 (-) Transcript_27285:217-786(-)
MWRQFIALVVIATTSIVTALQVQHLSKCKGRSHSDGPLFARKDQKRSIQGEVINMDDFDNNNAADEDAEAYADPVPDVCPECKDAGTYWDGMLNFACTACGYEWAVADAGAGGDVTKDSNGNALSDGDTCVLIKDLMGGDLKKGLTFRNIKIGDYGDGHDVRAKVTKRSSLCKGEGTYDLKSQFLKKTN